MDKEKELQELMEQQMETYLIIMRLKNQLFYNLTQKSKWQQN